MSSVQPIWRSAIPSAWLFGAAPNIGHERGLLLSSRWLLPDGSVQSTAPGAGPVHWPAPVPKAPLLSLRIDTAARPSILDIRLFHGGLDAAGVPTSSPQLVTCTDASSSPRPSASACQVTTDETGVSIVLAAPTTTNNIVLYAEWYISIANRPATAKDNPVVSASWGFAVA